MKRMPRDGHPRALYLEFRDHRNRWRKSDMRTAFGDMETVTKKWLSDFSDEANLATFREFVDFLEDQGLLTHDQLEAADNVLSWANALIEALNERSEKR